ncbi:MAG: hypothetical protein HDKAJFGB_02252 [Anaerolineae bacterium]|nr:hypothetical protein [Anaerolineae bacterium]
MRVRNDNRFALLDAGRRTTGNRAVHFRRVHYGFDLIRFLQRRLQNRQIHPRVVETLRAFRHLFARADEHERVEHLVGNQLRGGVIIFGAPRRRDFIFQLDVKADLLQRKIGQHAHHVNNERFAFRAIQRLAARLVHVRK